MKKYALLVFGVSVYVIVTMIDILVVSLPMTMYVAALTVGALIIVLPLVGEISEENRAPKPAVYHIRREPMLRHQYAK